MSLIVVKSGVIRESISLPTHGIEKHEISEEEYSNHLGATDDFTQTAVSAPGTATADATNHEMDLSTGTGAAGYAKFEGKKTWTPSIKPLIANFVLQNIVSGG